MRNLEGASPVHATCVAIDGKAALILGNSGSGKSSLALSLMALGAVLVADDRVILGLENGMVIAACPPAIQGKIEARGVGILRADFLTNVPVSLVIDLSQTETERVPIAHDISVLGVTIPLLHRVEGLHFASAIFQMMHKGRDAP